MIASRSLQIISREEAAYADRLAEWAKTPQQRLADTEFLRCQRYPDGIAPRFQRVVELIEHAQR